MVDVESVPDRDADPHARLFPGTEPKVVKLALDAGESVPAHTHPGRTVVLHLLSGEVALSLGGDEHRLEAGEVARFSGDQEVAPTAREDSEALLVLAADGD